MVTACSRAMPAELGAEVPAPGRQEAAPAKPTVRRKAEMEVRAPRVPAELRPPVGAAEAQLEERPLPDQARGSGTAAT